MSGQLYVSKRRLVEIRKKIFPNDKHAIVEPLSDLHAEE